VDVSPVSGNFIKKVWPWRGLAVVVLIPLVGGLMAFGYLWTRTEVTLVVNGQARRFYTHQTTVRAVLQEAGLEVYQEDFVSPALDAPLQPGSTIVVRQARPVVVEADGRLIHHRTHSRTVVALLREVGVRPKACDAILVDGQEVDLETRLAADSQSVSRAPQSSLDFTPLRVVLRRAVPIHIDDDGLPLTAYTTANTVGQALRAQDIVLYLGDQVNPGLDSRLSAGMRIYIQRSRPVEIVLEGRMIRTRTRKKTVAEVLAQVGVALIGRDYVNLRSDEPVVDGLLIRVVRARQERVIEQDAIPFETVWRPDGQMELDERRLEQEGEEGLAKRRIRIFYEDDQETKRVMEDEWIDHRPQTKIISYGTQIVPRLVDTPEGRLSYWRKIRVLATSYSPATAGVSPDNPHYGKTSLGLAAGKGVVAIDPSVINLWAEMYVPGYGRGVAGDTGGGIKGRHVDLGFDDDDLVMWYKWVDVYLLGPSPPANQIRWVLPNWPRESR
jgi:uncharacterized protein YabE (DUF348 family)